jgi:putative ATP-binding cassette transporter
VLIGLLVFVVPSLKEISVATLTGYALILLYMVVPLEVLSGGFAIIGRATVSLNQIESLGLSLKTDSSSDERLEEIVRPSWQTLELDGVVRSYQLEKDNSSFVLGPIDLILHSGELVFIIGGNGSGKTTLAKLLTGLYPPEAGEIRFNGQTITSSNVDDYREHFSAVFSDFYLFESLLGLEAPRLDAQAREYLSQLQLDGKVEVKDGVLSTLDLSQGQRKRLALLTAYLEDRPIYVFDEWAADQDPLFKEVFYFQLLPEMKARGKTVIVISHDDRYYSVGDRVIKLDSGRLVLDQPVKSLSHAVGESSSVSAA